MARSLNLLKQKDYVEKKPIQSSTNPFDCHGSEANVFKQEFNYPPTKEEKIKNNKINKFECLFPEEKIIPQGFNEKRCKSHDNVFCEINLESKKTIIHNGKPTRTLVMSLLHCIISLLEGAAAKLSTRALKTDLSGQVQLQQKTRKRTFCLIRSS